MVIAEVVDLSNNQLTFEGDENAEPTYEEETAVGDDEPEQLLAEPEAVFHEVTEDQDYTLSDAQGYASSLDSDGI
jgi:hypothetical protein